LPYKMCYNLHMMQKPQKPPRVRLAPTKILSLLQFGDYPWLRSKSGGRLSVEFGPMARDMRVSKDRLREHLEWLHQYGYLSELSLGRGEAELRLATPPNLNYQYAAEREAALDAIQRVAALKAVLVEIPESEDE
jgi:hypothetical protein